MLRTRRGGEKPLMKETAEKIIVSGAAEENPASVQTKQWSTRDVKAAYDFATVKEASLKMDRDKAMALLYLQRERMRV